MAPEPTDQPDTRTDDDAGGPDDAPDIAEGAAVGDGGRRWFQPPSAVQALALVVALLFVGGVAGWALGSGELDDSPNDVDVGFLQDMITHHEQALDMAYLTINRAQDPSTRRFAEEVAFFQAREIGIMQYKLEHWGYDLSERPDDAMAWMDMAVPVAQMPGLATDEQLRELTDATGEDVDRLFLELMIPHHLGGIHMAEDAARNASDDDVRSLAGVMARNQALEVEEYQRLQERLGFEVTDTSALQFDLPDENGQ